MHGRPVIQWVLFSAAWLLLLVPLISITGSRAEQDREVATDRETVHCWIALQCSSPPTRIELSQRGNVLWSEKAPSGRACEQPLALQVDDYGTDFTLLADFTEDVTAIEVTLSPDGRDAQSVTLWAEGDLHEQVEFLWGSQRE